ncbi:MAG TPA: rod shape-determining protein RodA [bacterium]|nr:rod shape-determining protein RodA [bacterium]HPL95488.1 rod shape-determining protein RodA [bacterium]
MWSKFFSLIKNFDWLLLVAVFLLIAFGLSTLYSLTLSSDNKNFNPLNRQIVFSLFGLVLLLIVSFIDYRFWHAFAWWLYGLSLVLLISVLFFGQTIQGTTGWFVFGPFNLQPVEIAKIAIIILLARFLSTKASREKISLDIWFKSFFIILPILLLVVLQPDFGSMVVIFLIWFAMLFLTGIKIKHFLFFCLILVILAVVGWQFFLQPYQKDRIITFLQPQLDPLGSGYNVRQSLIALGSGGLWGRGLGLGTQSQLHFLPVSEADFIFAALGEEWGFAGTLIVFLLYLVIFYRLYRIMHHCRNDFGLFLIFGLTMMFFIQFLINVGMATGVLPVTGLPLPFVSYGGSFLVMSLIAIGMIENVKTRIN